MYINGSVACIYRPTYICVCIIMQQDGQGPLSPVRRQLSLQSPPLSSSQAHAQSQPLTSPTKPQPASQGSQDSSLDMYAIERSATLPANFSLDSVRGINIDAIQ